MSDLPKNVVEFLRANAPDPDLSNTDITVERAAKFWGITYSAAAGRLAKLVAGGKATKTYKMNKTPSGRKRMAVYEIKLQ